MTESKEDKKFEQLVQKIDPYSKLLRTWALKGGISAQVTALEIERPDGQTKKMIVRQHGDVDLKHNPHVAADEFKLLQLLQSVGLATPTPYHLDQSGEIFPTPYVVIEYIEGTPEFAPSNLNHLILQLATISPIFHIGISAPLCDQLLKLPNGPPTPSPKKPCEKDTDCLSPRHLQSYPFNERNEPLYYSIKTQAKSFASQTNRPAHHEKMRLASDQALSRKRSENRWYISYYQ
jgi:hypothetical protein